MAVCGQKNSWLAHVVGRPEARLTIEQGVDGLERLVGLGLVAGLVLFDADGVDLRQNEAFLAEVAAKCKSLPGLTR
jgi:hypothetical protein